MTIIWLKNLNFQSQNESISDSENLYTYTFWYDEYYTEHKNWFRSTNCAVLEHAKFKIAINLMQISEIDIYKIKQISKILNKYNLDVFYIADSLGSLDENQLLQINHRLFLYMACYPLDQRLSLQITFHQFI